MPTLICCYIWIGSVCLELAKHLKWFTSPLMCVCLLCRFLVFVAVLLACCADAALVETTPLSLA